MCDLGRDDPAAEPGNALKDLTPVFLSFDQVWAVWNLEGALDQKKRPVLSDFFFSLLNGYFQRAWSPLCASPFSFHPSQLLADSLIILDDKLTFGGYCHVPAWRIGKITEWAMKI